jgi:hypothetical protein
MKKPQLAFLRPVITIISLFLLAALLIWYFFAFDIQWGFTWQAITWGLPILAAAIVTIVCLVKFGRRRKWRWGISAMGTAALAILYTWLILIFFSYYIAGEPANGPDETLDTEDNRIISLVLTEFFGDEPGYRVVDPQLALPHIGTSETDREHFGGWIQRGLFTPYMESNPPPCKIGEDRFFGFVDQFILKNTTLGPLTIKSSLQDGYYIDYDSKFARYFEHYDSKYLSYFESYEGAWLRMKFCRPSVGTADISLPLYDEETDFIIIYLGTRDAPHIGSGFIYLLQLQDGELEIISNVLVWHL